MLLNEKETDSFGAERNLHYICGANGLAAIYVTTADKDTMYYAYTDYQHNLLALTDAAGKPYERYSYDPWGNRRSATDWTVSDTLQSHIVDRGYTLHEHLDEFGLINMNGRVYDPKLACFLSPDPVISDAGNWLDYNRYSYAWGNPLKYCDPTGMSETEGDHMEAHAKARHIPSTEELVKFWYDTAVGQNANYVFSTSSYNSTETKWLNGIGYLPTVTVTAKRPSSGAQGNPFEFADEQFAKFQSWNPTGYDYSGYARQTTGSSYKASYWTTGAFAVWDIYNNFIHNHKTYKTTKGVTKPIYKANGAVRSAQAAKAANLSKFVKGVGTVGTGVMAYFAGKNIYESKLKGEDANTKDILDFSVGVVGLGTSLGVAVGVVSNPVGWAIGAGVAVYGVGSFVYDLCTER